MTALFPSFVDGSSVANSIVSGLLKRVGSGVVDNLSLVVGGNIPRRPAAIRQPRAEYAYVLNELRGWERDGAEILGVTYAPTTRTYALARRVLSLTAADVDAPDVSVEDNGTVLFMWQSSTGFVTLEIGDTEFGLVTVERGAEDRWRNADNAELGGAISEVKEKVAGARPFSPELTAGVADVHYSAPLAGVWRNATSATA